MTQKEYLESRNIIIQYFEPTLNIQRFWFIVYVIIFFNFILLLLFSIYILKWAIWITICGIVISVYKLILSMTLISETRREILRLNVALEEYWQKLNFDQFFKIHFSSLFKKTKKPLK